MLDLGADGGDRRRFGVVGGGAVEDVKGVDRLDRSGVPIGRVADLETGFGAERVGHAPPVTSAAAHRQGRCQSFT
jgi:hypothetical protein